MAALAVGLSGLPASAGHPSDGPRDPLTVAQHIAASPSIVAGASLGTNGSDTTDHAAVMAFTGGLAGFPRSGPGFGMLSTGDTNEANDPNDSESTSSGSDGGFQLDGLNSNQGDDLAGLTIDLNVPAVASPCLQVDMKFLSEEFPEFVGSAFNDFAVARVNNTTPPSVDASNNPVAPGNFLLDGFGQFLTINNNFLVNAGNAAGTTYDGATPTLRAQTALTPGLGAQTVTFWTGDAGDSIYDTTLFLDNLRILDLNPCPTATVGPSFHVGVKIKIKNGKIIARGKVLPPAPGQKVFLKLFAKGSPFKKVAKAKAKLNAQSKWKKAFKQPDAKRCKLKVVYKGDASHDPSKKVKKFKC